jgi:hypothetical protein
MQRRSFIGSGIAAGTALAIPVAAVSVEQFGIKPDSGTDITNALQRAVDAGTGNLFFPKGKYRLSGTVTVDLFKVGYTSLFGLGTSEIIKNGPGPAFHFTGTHEGTAGPDSFKEQVWQQERMPIMSGIAIRGEHPESIGIRLERIMQPTLTNMFITRCKTAVHLVNRNRNLLISHCHFYHNLDTGIHFDHVDLHQIIITGSHISYNRVAGIYIDGGAIRNFQITGNDIEYNYDELIENSADILFDSREEGSSFREGTIAGNTIQARPSPKGANIRILGGKELRTSGLIAITGNLIGSQTDGIHLKDCRSVTISGNTIYSAANHNVLIEDSANIVMGDNTIDWNPDHKGKTMVDGITVKRCKAVQISGNIIENSFHGSEAAGGTVEIVDSEDVAVSQCQILDPKYRGVEIINSKRCRVSDCTIIDRRTPVEMIDTIRVGKNCQSTLISGNILQKNKLKSSSNTTKVINNIDV